VLNRLCIKNFRNYSVAEINFEHPKVVFTGRNGQGKTNLLEAIFFLSMLRSFRTSHIRDMKKIGANGFYLGAEIKKRSWTEHLEAEYNSSGRRLLIDKSPVNKASDFIKQIKAVAFSPEDIDIVTGSSSLRRRFMDMLISVIDPQYLNALHNYSAGLKSRNAALKNFPVDQATVKAFEPIMAQNAVYILQQRKLYSDILSEQIKGLLSGFRPEQRDFIIKYRPDCQRADMASYMKRCDRERERDMKKGFTGFGPQLDDFDFVLQGKLMRNFASTGQCRLISLCLKMAKVNIIAENNQDDISNVLVLVDDVTGELDAITRELFFKVINQAGQAFFTFTERPMDDFFKDGLFFDIKDGKIL
jgi:DNA replication and repair protein RecF